MAPAALRQVGNTSALDAPVAIKMTHLLEKRFDCMHIVSKLKKKNSLKVEKWYQHTNVPSVDNREGQGNSVGGRLRRIIDRCT